MTTTLLLQGFTLVQFVACGLVCAKGCQSEEWSQRTLSNTSSVLLCRLKAEGRGGEGRGGEGRRGEERRGEGRRGEGRGGERGGEWK